MPKPKARQYRGKKTKQEQYVSRRLSGMSPAEARSRSFLCRSAAYRAEAAYAVAAQEAKARQIAANEQERASYEQKLRDKDQAARDLADRQRRLAALKGVMDDGRKTPRCEVCHTDHGCTCALKVIQAAPDTALSPEEYARLATVLKRPPIPETTLQDQLLGRYVAPRDESGQPIAETFLPSLKVNGRVSRRPVSVLDPEYDRDPKNPLFIHWEKIRNRQNNPDSNDRDLNAHKAGTTFCNFQGGESVFVSDEDKVRREQDAVHDAERQARADANKMGISGIRRSR